MHQMKKTKPHNPRRDPLVSEKRNALPDFKARMKRIFGRKKLKVSGAELIAKDREERF
jgi:hypothetical protein